MLQQYRKTTFRVIGWSTLIFFQSANICTYLICLADNDKLLKSILHCLKTTCKNFFKSILFSATTKFVKSSQNQAKCYIISLAHNAKIISHNPQCSPAFYNQ